MIAPEKYKSVSVTDVYNRSITPISSTQKEKLKLIVQNFLSYLKLKHS
jgi:hypothetical protein